MYIMDTTDSILIQMKADRKRENNTKYCNEWRKNNIEAYRKQQRDYQRLHQNEIYQHRKQYFKENYKMKAIMKTFRNILL
jgi:hypothetical protein